MQDGPRDRDRKRGSNENTNRLLHLKVGDTERFVIFLNPEAAERDAAMRAQLVAQLTEVIDGSDKLPVMKSGELRGRISTKPGLNRSLRVTPGGLLRVDAAKIKAEANLDGKYLLHCSDPSCRRGHRARLQATPGGRAQLAGHEAGHRPAAGLPPA